MKTIQDIPSAVRLFTMLDPTARATVVAHLDKAHRRAEIDLTP